MVPSPIGPLTVVQEDGELVRLAMSPPTQLDPETLGERSDEGLADVVRQLGEYFAGERTAFDLPLQPHGSDFELAVWHQLTRIPYGETRSYGYVAKAVGEPGGAQAVGAANGRNPIAIVVPVPSGDRGRRQPDRLRWRAAAQAVPARPRAAGRPPVLTAVSRRERARARPAAPATTRTTMNGARSASASAATASPTSRPSSTRSLPAATACTATSAASSAAGTKSTMRATHGWSTHAAGTDSPASLSR